MRQVAYMPMPHDCHIFLACMYLYIYIYIEMSMYKSGHALCACPHTGDEFSEATARSADTASRHADVASTEADGSAVVGSEIERLGRGRNHCQTALCASPYWAVQANGFCTDCNRAARSGAAVAVVEVLDCRDKEQGGEVELHTNKQSQGVPSGMLHVLHVPRLRVYHPDCCLSASPKDKRMLQNAILVLF